MRKSIEDEFDIVDPHPAPAPEPAAPPVAPTPGKRKPNGADGPPQLNRVLASPFDAPAEKPRAFAKKPSAAKAKVPPRIRINSGDLNDATGAAFELFKNEDDPMAAIYVRGHLLTRVERYANEGKHSTDTGHAEGSTILSLVSADWLTYTLGKKAEWFAIKQDKKGEWFDVRKDPHERVSRNIMAASPWHGLPVLKGIINAPTITLSGRILQDHGFDEESGILFIPDGTVFPRIKENPTKEDAEAAMEILKEPFSEFKWGDETSLSVALATTLTGLTRQSVDIAPLFANNASTRGSGKTLLAKIPSWIATGLRPFLTSLSPDPESEKKALFSALLQGPSCIVFDNIEGELGSAALCAMITVDKFSDRILGITKNAEVSTASLLIATGNNIVIKGDLVDRTLMCTINHKVENPSALIFKRDLPTWVPANRGRLAAAAITIIKAFFLHGRVPDETENDRFPQWQKLCRLPLIWLGAGDPLKSRERIKKNDPETVGLRNLLEAWLAIYPASAATVKAAIGRGIEAENKGGTLEATEKDLIEALWAIGETTKGISGTKVGKFISRKENRIIDNKAFERAGISHKTVTWKVVEYEPDEPSAKKKGGLGG